VIIHSIGNGFRVVVMGMPAVLGSQLWHWVCLLYWVQCRGNGYACCIGCSVVAMGTPAVLGAVLLWRVCLHYWVQCCGHNIGNTFNNHRHPVIQDLPKVDTKYWCLNHWCTSWTIYKLWNYVTMLLRNSPSWIPIKIMLLSCMNMKIKLSKFLAWLHL
jgi:hypothetical protein